MTNAHADEFGEVLRKRREQLTEEVRFKMKESRDQDVALKDAATLDDVDRATIASQESIRYAEAARDNRELAEVDVALERLKAGKYGVCADCGQQIPIARLRAYPAAIRCSHCQDAYELRLKSGTV